MRKCLKLDAVEKAGLVLSASPPGHPAVGPEFEVRKLPYGMLGIKWISDKGHVLYIYYVRSNKDEFRRTYREILNSAQLVD